MDNNGANKSTFPVLFFFHRAFQLFVRAAQATELWLREEEKKQMRKNLIIALERLERASGLRNGCVWMAGMGH
jgi:hypothetical protein